MTCHLRKQASIATNNNVRIGDMYGAASQTWAASDVWALWKVDDNDASYDTHLMAALPQGAAIARSTPLGTLMAARRISRTVLSALLILGCCR